MQETKKGCIAATLINTFFSLWCHQESNQGHTDYQTTVLRPYCAEIHLFMYWHFSFIIYLKAQVINYLC